MSTKVSVIVPVYNTRKDYFEKCIESIRIDLDSYTINIELSQDTTDKKKSEIVEKIARSIGYYIGSTNIIKAAYRFDSYSLQGEQEGYTKIYTENILKDGNLEKSMAFLVIEYLYIYVDIYLKNIMVNVVNAVGEK